MLSRNQHSTNFASSFVLWQPVSKTAVPTRTKHAKIEQITNLTVSCHMLLRPLKPDIYADFFTTFCPLLGSPLAGAFACKSASLNDRAYPAISFARSVPLIILRAAT